MAKQLGHGVSLRCAGTVPRLGASTDEVNDLETVSVLDVDVVPVGATCYLAVVLDGDAIRLEGELPDDVRERRRWNEAIELPVVSVDNDRQSHQAQSNRFCDPDGMVVTRRFHGRQSRGLDPRCRSDTHSG